MTLDGIPRMISLLHLLVVVATIAPRMASAQAPGEVPPDRATLSVPRFEIEASAIELAGPVRPGEYLGVTGPRSAWLGLETGEAELWVHPLKVGSGFRLGFSTPSYGSPIPGEQLARSVQVRPEITTITYSHAAFQVRQHILAPADIPGLLLLLEVDSPEPLEIIAEFEPVLNYMWPASIGGQYAYWDAGRRVFVLSESLQAQNAVVGSPWAANSVEHPAHQLGEAPRTMVIPVDPERARREFIPIAVAGGTTPREEVFESYERLISEARSLYDAKRAWADSVLASTVSIESPDPQLDLALEWAKINLEEQRVCNPDLGCGFVAGWGLSGNGARPGFGWFFGGDAAMNTFAMDALGQWALVAEELAFLARYQREDGKITHEISQAAARIDWFGTYPYAYYHADTTPYWMTAVYEYWRASGDDELLRQLWPAYRRAWEWCLTAETDGDGIIENTVGGLAAVEVGGLGAALHQDIYLAGVWVAALEGTRVLAEHMGEAELAAQAGEIAPVARATLDDAYWLEEAGHHAFGILSDGRTNDNLTVWPATAAAFGLFDEARAQSTLTHLAGDRVSSDWGAHMLSTESDLYDPLQYNMGTVWPFVTGYVAWGQYRYRRPWAGFHLMDAVKQMTFDWSLGRHPELLSGSFYQPLDQTVPHQFFATSMLATPLLRGVLGWEPDAPLGRARLAPQLPPDWPEVTVKRLRAGATATDVEIRQTWTATGGERRTTLTTTGPPLTFDFVPDVPVGAQEVSMWVNGVETEPSSDGSLAVPVGAETPGGDRAQIVVSWEGGLAVAPPRVDLQPGGRSAGLRILDFASEADGWTLSVEGTAGRTYDIQLFGTPVGPAVTSGTALVSDRGNGVIRVEFADGEGRSAATVRLDSGPPSSGVDRTDTVRPHTRY
ncbi:amylo-alpha-1,6-glucosidase [Candidatus Palauibacter sp.]|uniref:amylo-alpha-1,6-glucosidase n=1 Tax=Candidatus Palauibacter sp. TaxID=3101350 RepID=UPI003AF297B8